MRAPGGTATVRVSKPGGACGAVGACAARLATVGDDDRDHHHDGDAHADHQQLEALHDRVQSPRMTASPQTGPRAAVHRVVAGDESAGRRVDRVLAEALPQLSRTRIQALIDAGRVEVDGATLEAASRRVKPGQAIVVAVPPRERAPAAQALPLEVVFEDEAVIVVDKPPGLVVHPAPGNPDNTLVNALLHRLGDSLVGVGERRRPGIVHRLDKDTSGLLVAAKSPRAHRSLVAQFAARTIDRGYFALVWGVPAPAAGVIDRPLGRSPHNRKKMAVVDPGGKPAVTRYRVRRQAAGGALSLLECALDTGRTHQIRVHLAHIGHAVFGDPVYGRGRRRKRLAAAAAVAAACPRQALHAFRLGFAHPHSGRRLLFETALPQDLEALLTRFP